MGDIESDWRAWRQKAIEEMERAGWTADQIESFDWNEARLNYFNFGEDAADMVQQENVLLQTLNGD